MPEFEIYPINLRRHKKKNKETEQNSPMFALKLDFLAIESIRKTSNRAYEGKQITKHPESFFVCVLLIKTRGPTVI